MNEGGNMPEEIQTRETIEEQYTWRLGDIFESHAKWEEALLQLAEPLEKLLSFKDRVQESAQTLALVLDLDQECSIQMMELYVYAKMNKDLDNGDSTCQAMMDRITGEYYALAAKTSFIAPAISAIDEQTLRTWMQDEHSLEKYRHYLDNIIRNKKHILSEREETLLSQAGPMAEGLDDAFSMLNNLELDLGEILLENGEKVKLTHGKFGAFRENRNRDIRQQTYKSMHTAYQRLGNTIAAIYTTSIKGDVFFTKARGFDTCLEKALFEDNLPERIYSSLIESIHESLPSFYPYLTLRKKQMKLDALHLYDLSVPIVDTPEKEYSYEDAKTIVLRGLAPLGESYLDDVRHLFSSRSVDVFETSGKTSGAYAWGSYRSHPYMLLNWSRKLNDVFTLAHEAGHCMHTFYSDRHQPYVDSHYPIFLAEIASTVNENVLLRWMIMQCDTSTLEGKKEKAYLLNYFLEGVKNTVFRQTMFAEFEWLIHQKIEQGQAVTSKTLCETYESLLRLYFGQEAEIDDYMTWEWARIPHFYNAFYVYKYATGFCAATQISNFLFEEGESAMVRYKKFLSSGGRDYPTSLLDEMGVDMLSPQSVRTTMDEFRRDLAMLADLLEQIEQSE